MARPSKLTDKIKPTIELLARRGFTDEEIAQVINVSRQTLLNWKKADPEFFGTLKANKDCSDKEVERSLFERACGYECREDKVFMHEGKPVIVPTIKHYPPDPTSMIFWLKNRQPQKWRDKTEHDITSKGIEDTLREVMAKRG